MKKLMILSLIAVAFIIASCTNTGKKVEPVNVDSTAIVAPVETVDTVAVDAVVDLVDGIIDLVKDTGIKVARQVADDILDTANLILNLIEAEDAVGQEDGLVLDETNLILDFVQPEDIIR